jgi:hypothetical protein
MQVFVGAKVRKKNSFAFVVNTLVPARLNLLRQVHGTASRALAPTVTSQRAPGSN